MGHGDVSPVFMRVIVSGVKFIYSSNLVSNGLEPRKIMLDNFNNLVIIEFDSNKPLGTSMKGHGVEKCFKYGVIRQ